jgi:hypothetical protein
MFLFFGKVTNPEQPIIGSPPVAKPTVPRGDSEMAADAFWLIFATHPRLERK